MRRVLIAAVFGTLPTFCTAVTPFVPNDPYFYPGPVPTTDVYYGQWYLDKQNTGAIWDLNVRGAWNRGLTGEGVTIGVLDDAMEYTHPDLLPNYKPSDSWDFIHNDPDPSPDTTGVSEDNHATAVAGLAAARGGNGVGITGVAPYASLASLRVMPASGTFTMPAYMQGIIAAQRFHSTDTTRTIDIKNMSFGDRNCFYPLEFSESAEEDRALVEASRAGTIFVRLANNYRANAEAGTSGYDADNNRKTGQHLAEVITVAALTGDKFASYSGFGSCLSACVPNSSGVGLGYAITTDRVGENGYGNSSYPYLGSPRLSPSPDYTGLNGTSFAAPLMSGILALVKEAKPNLDSRMAKHLLARTCRIVDAADSTPMGGWHTNSAGVHFNNNYGFGLPDVDAMSKEAVRYSTVSDLVTLTSGELEVGASIPEKSSNGLSRSITLSGSIPLEEAQVRIKIAGSGLDTTYSELRLTLTSPNGTQSLLSYPNTHAGNFLDRSLDWTFTSNAFWGELPAGQWTVTLSNPFTYGNYVWTSFEVLLRCGFLIPNDNGDADSSGVVDSVDYNILVANYGTLQDSSWALADFDADGKVTTTDFNLLAGNFGVSSAALGANVPEPAMLSLLLPMVTLKRRKA